jgi:hypothetical protein
MEEPKKELYGEIRVDHTLIDKIKEETFAALTSGDGGSEGEDEEMKDAE